MKINYDDLCLAFDFVSAAAPMEHRAYVSRETGKVYCVSELDPVEEEEIPEDLETSDLYVEIPHKNDLDLGRELAFRFIDARLPAQRNRVVDMFHRRGAYRRFKELLAAEGHLERWYAFEAEATERVLRAWCQQNNIHLEGNEEQSGQPMLSTSTMRPGQIQANEFELAILERIGRREPSILNSADHLRVLSRKFTGVGSFTEFACEESSENIPAQKLSLDAEITMPGVPNGLGAVLFCRGGRPQCLEIFAYGDDHWDGVYDGFAIEQAD